MGVKVTVYNGIYGDGVKADVVTLALGSQPKQRFAKVRAKREAHESHLMLPRV